MFGQFLSDILPIDGSRALNATEDCRLSAVGNCFHWLVVVLLLLLHTTAMCEACVPSGTVVLWMRSFETSCRSAGSRKTNTAVVMCTHTYERRRALSMLPRCVLVPMLLLLLWLLVHISVVLSAAIGTLADGAA